MNTTMWIGLLEKEMQKEIRKDLMIALIRLGLEDEELSDTLEEGMDGRLCDLSDAIDIEKYC